MTKILNFVVVSCCIITICHCETITEDAKDLCNEEYFRKNYVEKGKYISMRKMNETCSPVYKKKCVGLSGVWVTMMENEIREEYSLTICPEALHFTGNSSGCWGAVMEYQTHESKEYKETRISYELYDHRFAKIAEKPYKKDDCWSIRYKLKTNYTVQVTTAPVGRIFKFNWTSPGRCELETVTDIHDKAGKDHCIDLNQRFAVARSLCQQFQGKDKQREAFLRRNLVINNCSLHLLNNTEPPATDNKTVTDFLAPIETENKNKNIVIIAVSCVTALVVFILLLVRTFWGKRRQLTDTKEKNEKALLKDNDTIWQHKDVLVTRRPAVMILNRPGCELLEVFLRDLAFILKSYEIDVNLALLEQNQIDAEGGIASYMQRNIDTCAYILIMFTEDNKDASTVLKHKPYEFALKVLGGLAYHENDASRYIPIYISSYREVVKVLPSFLNASSTFGFRLPKDIEKLVRRIHKKDVFPSSKERNMKDTFFINKMREQAKKILLNKHPHCLKENCTKGEAYSSIVNLSSIWPSTVNSKWRSTTSIDFNEEKNIEEEKILRDDNLQYKIQTMLQEQTFQNEEDVGYELSEIEYLLRQSSGSSSTDEIMCRNQTNT